MTHPIYSYSGLRLYKLEDGAYSIDRLGEEYGIIEKTGTGYAAYLPSVWAQYDTQAERLKCADLTGTTLKGTFRAWVDSSYGTAYKQK